MYLHGSFVSKRKETVTVEIVTRNDRTLNLEIGGDSGILFPEDPVEIRSEVNDTFDPLFRSSASIRLLTRGLIPDLCCSSVLDAVVNITLSGKCVFAGYLVPQSYSQPFSKVYDELEINCIDAISALQYLKYRDIGSAGVDYAAVKASAGMRTFRELLENVFQGVTGGLDLSGEGRCRILYDGSITLETGKPLFGDLSISELLFLGSSEDEAWDKLEVAEEIMRYLNLHMVQVGMDFRIYSLDTVKKETASITWRSLSGSVEETAQRKVVTITPDIATSTDGTLSIAGVYNRLELTCEVAEMVSLVESPLDSDTMRSPYSNRQLYLTEYTLAGGGTNDAAALIPIFKAMVEEGKLDSKLKSSITDWYIQVYDSMNWRFPMQGSDGTTLVGYFCDNNGNQQRLPNYLSQHIGCGLVAFGKVKREGVGKDNSPTAKVDMETSLVVGVNGNGKDTQSEAYPTEAALIAASPVAEYIGEVSGGVFSPSDNETVNYIVISGRMVLNPLFEQIFPYSQSPWLTGSWPQIEDNPGNPILGTVYTVPGKDYEKGRIYCAKWYSAPYPGADPVVAGVAGLMPYTGEVPEQYEYKYSAIGDGNDTISKIGVLACMLIIGDKCVVETGTDGSVGDFEWKTYKTREQCASDDEYYAQSFTLGFDPKIGDKLVGTEFDLQNNIDYRMGLDMEGTAIPIRKDDKVSGKVTFRILGPVNIVWDEVTRRHKTWFRKAKWSSTSVPLLAHVSSILIKDFNVRVCSDNGLINNTDDCDLVYMSDTAEQFVNVKDDLKFRITSALTRDERVALGISDSLKLSSPVVVSTGDALLRVTNSVTGVSGKPEQLYVDGYYREYRKPRVGLVHKLRSDSDAAGQFNRYIHPALPDMRFFVQGISRGLGTGWTEVTLKEVDND